MRNNNINLKILKTIVFLIFILFISNSYAADKAIVVAGSGPYPENLLWPTTKSSTNYAYQTLLYRGFTKERILYLASDDFDGDNNGDLDDVDADATNSNLQYAISTWATDADNLIIYLTGHSGAGTFLINRMSGNEILSATDLDIWIDALQTTISGTVIFIYDASYAGSFLPVLIPSSGKNRILIASCERYSYADGFMSFSHFFWNKISLGFNLYDAFLYAKNIISQIVIQQIPLIDDNDNGRTCRGCLYHCSRSNSYM